MICEEMANIIVSDKNKDILYYQFAAARYGRDFMKFNIQWYERFLDEIRGEAL